MVHHFDTEIKPPAPHPPKKKKIVNEEILTLPNVTRESNSTRARAEHSIPYGTENIVRSSSFVYIGGPVLFGEDCRF